MSPPAASSPSSPPAPSSPGPLRPSPGLLKDAPSRPILGFDRGSAQRRPRPASVVRILPISVSIWGRPRDGGARDAGRERDATQETRRVRAMRETASRRTPRAPRRTALATGGLGLAALGALGALTACGPQTESGAPGGGAAGGAPARRLRI